MNVPDATCAALLQTTQSQINDLSSRAVRRAWITPMALRTAAARRDGHNFYSMTGWLARKRAFPLR